MELAHYLFLLADLDRTDLLIYEEVARMPPFQRKCLVLLGAKGVGRRVLKQMLIKADPKRFTSIVPCKTYFLIDVNASDFKRLM
jgi:hypothetical protein